MNYKDKLLKIRVLEPTEKILAAAKKIGKKSINTRFNYDPLNYIFYRSCIENGILKISLFLLGELNDGNYTPFYDIFFDYEKQRDLVYDCRNHKWKHVLLYNLPFPERTSCVEKYENIYAYKEDQKRVRDYVFRNCDLWCDKDIWDSIVHFQEENRRIARQRKKEKLSAQINKKMELVPALPGDWRKWVEKVGADKNYIFYDAGKGVQTGYCTYCEREVPVIKPRYNKMARCRHCGKKIQYKSNRKRGKILDQYEVYLLQNCGQEFVLRAFLVQKIYPIQDNLPEILFVERRRLFYRNDFSMEEYHWGIDDWEYKWKKGRLRIGGCSLCSYLIGYPNGRIYGKTLPSLSKTFLKHTGFKEYFQKEKSFCPEKYFETYQYMPFLEQLAKAGLIGIAKEVISGMKVTLDNSKTDLLGKLRIDHAQLLRLRKAESIKRLEWLQYEKETGKQIDDHLISWYIEQGLSPASIFFIKGRMSALQIKNYLSRQSAENGEKIGNVLSIWMDYLRMADSLGWDTQDAIIYRARKLFQRHDEASQCLRRKKLQERISEKKTAFPTIQQICSSIRKKYEYRSDKEVYEILVPNGIEDILAEGECLKHCIDVNNLYLQRIADRETYILFLRKRENPMQPYFTLEVEPNGTVRQKSTYYNRQEKNMDEINQFLKRWQRVIQKRLSKQDKLWTEESQRKREEEYLQLRKEKKIIFAGNYNGRLLADILEENLLEAEAEPAA